MEFTADVAAQWPLFADPPVPGLAALHCSDHEMGGDAGVVVTSGAVGPGRYLAVFSEERDDTPLRRKLTFWTAHPDVAALGETWAAHRLDAGTIRAVALLDLGPPDGVLGALRAVRERLRGGWSLGSVLVVLDADVDVDEFARALPATSADHEPGNGSRVWLLRAGLDLGIVVVVREESLDGRGGLGFYSTPERIDRVRAAASALRQGRR